MKPVMKGLRRIGNEIVKLEQDTLEIPVDEEAVQDLAERAYKVGIHLAKAQINLENRRANLQRHAMPLNAEQESQIQEADHRYREVFERYTRYLDLLAKIRQEVENEP